MSENTKEEFKKTPPKPGTERLQVVLARFGIASRRGVVSLIEEGKVTVNGEVVREKGFRVDAKKDEIKVSDQEFTRDAFQQKRYFVFYKPKNVMTTMQDPHATAPAKPRRTTPYSSAGRWLRKLADTISSNPRLWANR